MKASNITRALNEIQQTTTTLNPTHFSRKLREYQSGPHPISYDRSDHHPYGKDQVDHAIDRALTTYIKNTHKALEAIRALHNLENQWITPNHKQTNQPTTQTTKQTA